MPGAPPRSRERCPPQPLSPRTGRRGAARPPPPVRWRYRLYNHGYSGEGKKNNNNKRNNPLIVRNAGSRPRGGPGGSGARWRDAPFPRGALGVARTPAAAAGAWPSGTTRAKSGASGRAEARRSRPCYRENILSGTGRRHRPVPNRGAGRNPRAVSRPSPAILLSKKLLIQCPQPAWALMAGCLISPTPFPGRFFFLVCSPAFPLGVEPPKFSGSRSVAATGVRRSRAALGAWLCPSPIPAEDRRDRTMYETTGPQLTESVTDSSTLLRPVPSRKAAGCLQPCR